MAETEGRRESRRQAAGRHIVKEERNVKIKVRYFCALLQKERTREFENYTDAFEFAESVNGIVVA